MRLWISKGASFLCLLLLGAAWLGFAAQASSISEQIWTASGPGTRAAAVDGTTGDLNFSYQFTGPQVHDGLTWTYTATATVTETIYYNWNYTGLHAWFLAAAKVSAFAYGPGNDYREVPLFDGTVWHNFSYSGESQLQVHAGYAYGFKIYGKNFDSNAILRGNLAIVADKNPPLIVPVVSGTQGSGGWYRSDVQLGWNVMTKPALPILSQTGCGSATISVDTPGSVFTCTATSDAGTTTNSVTLKRDATAPVITGTAAVPPNESGWYTSPVTVLFHCSDAMSDVSSCTSGTVVMTEGANQSVTGAAADNAGNSASVTVTGIHADWTPPATTDNAPTRAVREDVTVTLTASDNVSVVGSTYYRVNGSEARTGDRIGLTSEGAYSIVYWSKDSAGNVEPQRSAEVVIDRTPPVTAHNAPVGPVSRTVTVTLAPSDHLTAIAATYYKVDGGYQQNGTAVTIEAAGAHAVEYWSVDQAGNVEGANTVIVTIDKTPPVTTARVSPDGASLRLQGQDNLSVQVATYYRLDNGNKMSGDSVPLNRSGLHTIAYWSEDEAGNSESPHVIVFLDMDGNGWSDIVDVVMAANARLDANGDGLFTREDVILFLQSVTTLQPVTME